MEVELQSVTPGTAIAGSSTIDSLFNSLFANRSGTQGTIAYLWSDPTTVMGKYADGSCVMAHFEARALGLTVITGGAVSSPTLVSVSPATVAHGASNTPITLSGTNFVSGAVASASGTALTTGFTNSTTLTATILAAQLVSAGSLAITVQNPDGQITGSVTFTVS